MIEKGIRGTLWFYFPWTSILSQLMIEDLSGKNLLTLFPISSRQQSARHPLGLAVGGWRKDIICLWKVDRVLANHSLGSTASQGTSNIPFPWFLLSLINRQAQKVVSYDSCAWRIISCSARKKRKENAAANSGLRPQRNENQDCGRERDILWINQQFTAKL